MKILAVLAYLILGLWVFFALISPLLPIQPNHIDLSYILSPPSWDHWFGYDDLGRSQFARVIVGSRTSLFVSIIVVFISFIVGTLLGVVSAWFGGYVDKTLVFIIDLFIAFPGILLAIALAGLLGAGLVNAMLALVIVNWVGFARLSRAQTLSVKEKDHILAARSLGMPTERILWYHVLPLIMSPLIIEATFNFAGIIIAEASLSFLGLGVQPPQASLGSMVRNGMNYMLVSPHVVIVPAMIILVIVLSINLVGDYLRDYLDVKSTTK